MKISKTCSWTEIISLAVKQEGKFAVYVSNGLEFNEEDVHIWDSICKDCIELIGDGDEHSPKYLNVVSNLMNQSLFFFDNEEECRKFYHIFDKSPVYSSSVYAATYSSIGECLTENT